MINWLMIVLNFSAGLLCTGMIVVTAVEGDPGWSFLFAILALLNFVTVLETFTYMEESDEDN